MHLQKQQKDSHFQGLLFPNTSQWVKALNPSVVTLFDLGRKAKHSHLNMMTRRTKSTAASILWVWLSFAYYRKLHSFFSQVLRGRGAEASTKENGVGTG